MTAPRPRLADRVTLKDAPGMTRRLEPGPSIARLTDTYSQVSGITP